MHVSFDDIVPEQPGGPRDRYVLEEGDGDPTYCLQVHDRKQKPGQQMIGPNFSEAEAGVIQFALNAVASGHELQFVTEEPDENGENVFVYEGPTEGVRA